MDRRISAEKSIRNSGIILLSKQAPDVKSIRVCSHFPVASTLSPIFTLIRMNVCRRFAPEIRFAFAIIAAERSRWKIESKLPATVASRSGNSSLGRRRADGESRARLDRIFHVIVIKRDNEDVVNA